MNGPSTIHRYSIDLRGSASLNVKLPGHAQPLFLGRRPNDKHGQLSVWFQVPTAGPGGDAITGPGRTFEIHGTGHDVPAGRDHVASVIDGMFVWHLFEVRP